MILVWQMRQDIEYYKARVLVQAAIDIKDGGKAADEAWKAYTDVFYPHVKGRRESGDKVALAALMREVKKGGLAVRPMMPLMRSKIHNKKIRHYDRDHNDLSIVRERKSIATPGQRTE